MTDAMKKALKWLQDRGGDCAVARTKNGGRIFLAQGETAPFTVGTAKNLVEVGLAEYSENRRFRLIGQRSS